ncbi:uncharacterized protein LOC132619984 [Lycium barbarum]|uniref:uncharacterized protein LOC132619984 n=1 Tax=Lycium barbarum TaxID=112863 RepID=UPI00293E88C1|nr:uncharacterized protein LOC132619984 [Lycium barbarum]
MVYEKYDAMERLVLWNNLYVLADGMVSPWLIRGDFNVILNEEENIGRLPVLPNEYEDFSFCLNSCELIEADHESFQSVITQNWHAEDERDVCLSFKEKVKKIKSVLSAWSRQYFGNIFKQLTIREDIVRIKEQLFEEALTEVNRMVLERAQAELKKYLHYDEEYWRQKSGYDCFAEEDRNTRFFHNIINGRWKRTQIRRIQSSDGNWIENANEIADEAISF